MPSKLDIRNYAKTPALFISLDDILPENSPNPRVIYRTREGDSWMYKSEWDSLLPWTGAVPEFATNSTR